VALAPALVETYSRLLVYMEIESLGIKGFISKKVIQVFSLFVGRDIQQTTTTFARTDKQFNT